MSPRPSFAAYVAGIGALAATANMAAPAAADATSSTSSDPLEASSDHPDHDYVTDQLIDPNGTPLGSPRIVAERPDEVTASSTRAGTPSSKGCRRITVHNKHETALGDTGFWFHTWTEWCWDRSARSVSSVRTGQYFSDVAATFKYRKLVLREEFHYAYVSGYNKSGYRHNRQAHWETCLLDYGCIGSFYPRNAINSHHDGTYATSSN